MTKLQVINGGDEFGRGEGGRPDGARRASRLRSLALLMPHHGLRAGAVEEVEVLRLQAQAALSIVPLISRVVPSCDDRAVIVADVVARWLSWPENARRRCRHVEHPPVAGLETFTGDYVDHVERGADGALDGDRPVPEEAMEQAVLACWQRHLRELKEEQASAVAWLSQAGASWPNDRLRRARLATACQMCGGPSMCRQALAEAVNRRVRDLTGRAGTMDAGHIGKLERGLYRWPRAYYRQALRLTLGAKTDADLGFVCIWGMKPKTPDGAKSDPAAVMEIHRDSGSE